MCVAQVWRRDWGRKPAGLRVVSWPVSGHRCRGLACDRGEPADGAAGLATPVRPQGALRFPPDTPSKERATVLRHPATRRRASDIRTPGTPVNLKCITSAWSSALRVRPLVCSHPPAPGAPGPCAASYKSRPPPTLPTSLLRRHSLQRDITGLRRALAAPSAAGSGPNS